MEKPHHNCILSSLLPVCSNYLKESNEDVDVECGYVSVPEEYENPNGSKIQLAVAIIRSKDSQPKPDPLFMAQGGPWRIYH